MKPVQGLHFFEKWGGQSRHGLQWIEVREVGNVRNANHPHQAMTVGRWFYRLRLFDDHRGRRVGYGLDFPAGFTPPEKPFPVDQLEAVGRRAIDDELERRPRVSGGATEAGKIYVPPRLQQLLVGAGDEALAFLERGDYFGEMALIDRQPRSADARAHGDGAVVLTISAEVLEGILDIQKVSSLRLLRLLCRIIAKRLRQIDDKLVGWYIFNAGAGVSLNIPRPEEP